MAKELKDTIRKVPKLLSDIIKVRNDGFIYNDLNEAVFYANKNATTLLNSLKEKTVDEFKSEFPATSNALMI